MIRDVILISAVSLSLAGCGGPAPAGESQSLMEVSKQELADAVADRDRLLALVQEIASDMEQIHRLEHIMTESGGRYDGNPTQSARILADMAKVRQELQKRREKLAELELRLASSELDAGELQGTIDALRRQIDSRVKDIDRFRNQLLQADERITALSGEVDSLSIAVDSVSRDLDAARAAAVTLENEINRCYFVIASKPELKEHHVIETGFLRKTKLMEGDFDRHFFTVGDKRAIKSIPLNSDKVKIYTNHPADSYAVTDIYGYKSLEILSPDLFWSLSNYLVIETD